MLAESIIRLGKPILRSNLPNEQRLRWLTDVDNPLCKNFFHHIFIVERNDSETAYHFLQMDGAEQGALRKKTAFPVLYPQGGNALNAQGFYPTPCYLMYDPHIKQMKETEVFAEKVIQPRLKKTIPYQKMDGEELRLIALQVAKTLSNHFEEFISEKKQLGILYLIDHSLPLFHTSSEQSHNNRYLWITESKLQHGAHLCLDSEHVLSNILEAKFSEAKTLGHQRNAISTFTNQQAEEVASIYNKYWLWLSPTWEMPRSIYWGKKDWTSGIKIDRSSYEAFLYGTQFLNQITLPINNTIMKELFAPVMNVQAKKQMKSTRIEPIYGVPMVLPLLDGDSEQQYEKYNRILKNDGNKNDSDLHLELLAGIQRVIPRISDQYRLTLLYYSGELNRGNMHIRMMIEDVIPSTAEALQKVIKDINRKDLADIRKAFQLDPEPKSFFRTHTLPAMLSNAYGPGYVWNSLQAVFHRQPITANRLYHSTARKLKELALKEDYRSMRYELTFHHAFLSFYEQYHRNVVKREKRVNRMSDWSSLLERYHTGQITVEELSSSEKLGFVSGLLLKQFSNSFRHKIGKEFVKHRVMKFGNQLSPEIIWKNGIMRCEELAQQWDMKLGKNFRPVLSQTLLAFLNADLVKEKDHFITAFWSGYLMYRKEKEEA